MKKQSKRINNLKNLLTENGYSVEQAIPLVKKIGTAKFEKLNLDSKN